MMAAWTGDFEMVAWMRRQTPRCPWDSDCTAAAAAADNLHAFKWMLTQSRPCPWDPIRCFQAFAGHGNLAAVQWIRDQYPQPHGKPPWDGSCTAAAALGGSLDLLKWLRSQSPPCPWAAKTGVHAACVGSVPMLAWLHSQGCPLDGTLYHQAAIRRHAHVLQWLHGAGIPVPTDAISDAYGAMGVPITMFMGDIGCPLCPSSQRRLMRARRAFCTFHGLLRWCRNHQPVYGQGPRRRHAFDQKFRNGKKDLLVGLSRLPPELVSRIAVAAGLQHDLL